MRDRLASQDALVGLELTGGLMGGHRGPGVGDARGVQLQTGTTDLEFFVVLEGVFLDLLAGHERAADAVRGRPA